MSKHANSKSCVLTSAVVLTGMMIVGTASAATKLSLTLPDLFVSGISANYDALNDLFTANGIPAAIDLTPGGGPELFFSAGSFNLTAILDASGTPTGGSFTVAGTVNETATGNTVANGTVLEGTLVDFFNNGSDGLEFLLAVADTDATPNFLSPNYGGIGSTFGIVFSNISGASPNPGTGNPFDLGQNFSIASAQANVGAVVPTPGSLALLLLGVVGLGARRFQSRRLRA